MAEVLSTSCGCRSVSASSGDFDLAANTRNAVRLHRGLLSNLQEVVAGDSAGQLHVAVFDIHIDPPQLLVAGGAEAGTHGVRQVVVVWWSGFGRR